MKAKWTDIKLVRLDKDQAKAEYHLEDPSIS